MARILPTSRTAALPPRVPNVIIPATFSSPYLFLTYFITSSLFISGKSVSISGIVTRSGFKNLSNSKLYFKGSTSVIPKQYETKEPAAEPRPGPTKILFCFAYFM